MLKKLLYLNIFYICMYKMEVEFANDLPVSSKFLTDKEVDDIWEE